MLMIGIHKVRCPHCKYSGFVKAARHDDNNNNKNKEHENDIVKTLRLSRDKNRK